MTSSKTLKKIVSTGAALMLALVASLVATTPARAADDTSLSSLTITGSGTWSATFSPTTLSYTYTVPNSVSTIDIVVTAANANTRRITVVNLQSSTSPVTTLTRTLGLSEGSNGPYSIEVMGQDYSFTTYTVTVVRTPAVPTLTAASVSNVDEYGARINFTSSMTGIASYVIKAAAAAAPTDAAAISAGTYTTDVIARSASAGSVPPGQSYYFRINSGLLPSTAYSAYVVVTATSNSQKSAIARFDFTTSASSQQNNNQSQNMNVPTQLVAPTISVVGNFAVATTGTYSSGSIQGNWEYCATAKAAVTAPTNQYAMDCGPLFVTLAGGSNYANVAHALTLDLTGSYYTRTIGSMNNTLSAVSLAGKFVRYQEFVNVSGFFTATVPAVAGAVTSTDSTDVTDITEDQRPLPVWASNIVSSIPTLTKALVSTGGSVALTGGDYADLKSITIGGKAVAFKIETTGNVNIPVPAGEAGKTADIVIVFGGGTMTVQDGIKYVAQVDVAKVAERPIAIAAGAKKITEAIADQIRQAAFANPKNTHIQCVAYAANSSAKAQAAAKLTAVQACGIAAKANPALKISEVSVIVNKAKARQSAVGIKVYKQN